MSTVVIAGNIGKVEHRMTQAGKGLTKISVAETHYVLAEKKTVWYTVTIWDSNTNSSWSALDKGDKIIVIGTLNKRSYKKADGSDGVENELTPYKIEKILMTSGSSSIEDDIAF